MFYTVVKCEGPHFVLRGSGRPGRFYAVSIDCVEHFLSRVYVDGPACGFWRFYETMVSNCFELSGETDTVTNGGLMANSTVDCHKRLNDLIF